jgi:hypothetical protein
MKTIVAFIASGVLSGAVGPVLAQARRPPETPQSIALALRDPRYQIGLMEGILQRAAEHGAKVTRDRMRAVIPGDMLLSDDVRVRGFRLDGYGVFFDIDMPDLEGTLPWIVRTLDQNDLGLDSAFRSIRSLIESSGTANDRQALQRIEMQLAPSTSSSSPVTSARVAAQTLAGSAASTVVNTAQAAPPDPIVNDPQGVYRAEVIEALIEAILDHSNGLRLEPVEWLTVAARGRDGSPRLSPADTESPTIQISVRGEDLSGLLARQISREDARKRIVIKVF